MTKGRIWTRNMMPSSATGKNCTLFSGDAHCLEELMPFCWNVFQSGRFALDFGGLHEENARRKHQTPGHWSGSWIQIVSTSTRFHGRISNYSLYPPWDRKEQKGYFHTVQVQIWVWVCCIDFDIVQKLLERSVFSVSRNFLKSKWGMEEFTLAYAEALKHTKINFIIIILKENIDLTGLRKDMKMFLKTHNYIDATKNIEQVPERLRWERNHSSMLRCLNNLA